MERDWLNIVIQCATILIPSVVAWWVGNKIQKKLDNEKSLRSHIVNELLDIRTTYRRIADAVRSGNSTPKEIKSELSLMSVHITDLMALIKTRKGDVSKDFLLPYQLEFNTLITDDDNYISNYQDNKPFKIGERTNAGLTDFEKTHHHLFNDLIILIFD